MHCTTLQYTSLQNTPLHYPTLHPATLHCTTLEDPHQVQWHQVALVGHMSQVALLALTYLTTGVVPASKAPLLDTSPVGAVEGLIGAGPLIVVSQSLTDFPKTLLRPSTDLPETFHRSSTDLSRIFHRSGTHKNQKSLNSFSRITASFLASAPHP